MAAKVEIRLDKCKIIETLPPSISVSGALVCVSVPDECKAAREQKILCSLATVVFIVCERKSHCLMSLNMNLTADRS